MYIYIYVYVYVYMYIYIYMYIFIYFHILIFVSYIHRPGCTFHSYVEFFIFSVSFMAKSLRNVKLIC